MSKLSEDQVDAILQAARPLPPADREAFFQDVTDALADLDDLGDGVVYRVTRDVQRKYWNPPAINHAPRSPSPR